MFDIGEKCVLKIVTGGLETVETLLHTVKSSLVSIENAIQSLNVLKSESVVPRKDFIEVS